MLLAGASWVAGYTPGGSSHVIKLLRLSNFDIIVSLIGDLIWATMTYRPALSVPVTKLSQCTVDPAPHHHSTTSSDQ